MGYTLKQDAEYFLDLQTQTGWGRTLTAFAEWCQPQPGWFTVDIGCGPGLLPTLFHQLGCIAFGIDADVGMFSPRPLHPLSVVADGYYLPFPAGCFDMVTASNLVFLLSDPCSLLVEIKRVLRSGGTVAFLNPSEKLNLQAAVEFADQRNLQGLARDTFLNWAERAETNHRWSQEETIALFAQAGLLIDETVLRIGPGFARLSRGRSII